MGRFCGKVLEIVHSWSYDRNTELNPNAKIFHSTPVVALKDWKKAYDFAKVSL